jgi:hypothetical protein
MMQLEMHGSEQSYMSARKWHPFVAVVGLKGAPRATVQEHVTPFNTAGHLPVACGGALLFPSGRLAGAHKQSVPRSGGEIVLALENS